MQHQVQAKSSMEARLKKAEESLRTEMIESEEQRAYIAMLKEQLGDKMVQMGMSFDSSKSSLKSGGKKPQKPVDGYLALVQCQKLVEQLQLENSQLRAQHA